MKIKKNGESKGEQRRKCLLRVAGDLFLEKGFEKTSVNEIVRRAGGSLSTLYAMFPSKEALFQGILSDLGDKILAPLVFEDEAPKPIRDVLLELGRVYVAVLSEPSTLALHRLLVAEGPRVKALRDIMLGEFNGRGRVRFNAYFQSLMDLGLLKQSNTDLVSSQFTGMLRGSWHMQATIGAPVDPVVVEQTVVAAVDVFLAYYQNPAKSQTL